MHFYLYGRDKACSSCVGSPSSLETKEWLESALNRRYNNLIQVTYVDVDKDSSLLSKRNLLSFENGDRICPVLMSGDTVVDEGVLRLKNVCSFIDAHQ